MWSEGVRKCMKKVRYGMSIAGQHFTILLPYVLPYPRTIPFLGRLGYHTLPKTHRYLGGLGGFVSPVSPPWGMQGILYARIQEIFEISKNRFEKLRNNTDN